MSDGQEENTITLEASATLASLAELTGVVKSQRGKVVDVLACPSTSKPDFLLAGTKNLDVARFTEKLGKEHPEVNEIALNVNVVEDEKDALRAS